MVPTEAFVDEHDPQELYCVCTAFDSRYKVPWNEDASNWVRQVRNVLGHADQGWLLSGHAAVGDLSG